MRPEAAFQNRVISWALMNSWKAYHPPDNRPMKGAGGAIRRQSVVPGFPDLTLGHLAMRRLIFAELKAEGGRLSDHQKEWLQLLEIVGAANGFEVYVWRPSDWDVLEDLLRWER